MTATLGSPGAATQRPAPDTASRSSTMLDDAPSSAPTDPGPLTEGTFGRRAFAHLTDTVLSLIAVFGVAGSIVGQSGDVSGLSSFSSASDYCSAITQRSDISVCVGVPDWSPMFGNWAFAWSAADLMIMGVTGFMFWLLVLVLLQGRTGFTPGKYIAGLRVIDQEGNLCGTSRALTRSVLWIVDSLPIGWIVPVVGTIAALTNTGYRRVGDLVAGTWVVPVHRMAEVGAPATPVAAAAVATAPAPVASDTSTEVAAFTEPAPSPEPTAAEPAAITEPAVSPEPVVAEQPSPFAPPAEETGDPSLLAREAFAEPEPADDTEPSRSIVAAEPQATPTQTYAPQWDAARNAYICWEPTRGQWLQHDSATGGWEPIS